MQRRISRNVGMLAAAATLAAAAGTAAAQSAQQRQQEYERQRQQNLERQFERQQQQMQREQQRIREHQPYGPQSRFEQQRSGQQPMDPQFIDPQTIVVIGVDMDEDGLADATYFVPGDVVQQLAREHRNRQRAGMRSMQFQPWQRIQQTSQRGEGQFEDLPISTGGEMGGGMARQAQLSGTVTETRTAQLAGHAEPSKLAKVRLNDGSTVFADLGPAQNFRNVRLSRGDQVSIAGSPAWINNQPVIFADRVQTPEGVIPVRRQPTGGQEQFRQQDRWQQQDQWQQQDPWGRQDQFRQQDQWEQQQRWREQDRWQQQQQPRQRFQTGMGQQMEQISGTITATDEVTIGNSEPYTFVKVRDDSGATGWVSLGPTQDVQNLDLSRNDRIEVLALPLELQGETVYYAHQLRANGETMRLSQREGGQGARIQPAGMGQMHQLSGTVQNKKEISIGESDPYLFVELRTDDGRTQWVNLGPKDQVEDLDLARNDRLSVAATETDIHGETIFHAQQLTANGQSRSIQQTGHR